MSKITRKRSVFVGMLLVLTLAWGNGVFAQAVSQGMAQSVAETFFNHNVRNGNGQPIHFEDITAETPFQNFYVFSADSGFVLVAADERVTPILGYSKTDRFVIEDMPENLRWWLEGYDIGIQNVIDGNQPPKFGNVELWQELKSGTYKERSEMAVSPMLTTEWDQSSRTNDCDLYNNLCPSGTLTGCEATTMAQIMKYWNWPIHGIGSHSYPWNGQTLSADFGNTTYQWSNMPNKLTCSSLEEEVNAVAVLMKHCGVAVEMQYGQLVSNAKIKDAVCAYKEYFGYASDAKLEYMYDHSDDEWETMLKTDLNSGKPVHYRGVRGTNAGGHAFVIDGYKTLLGLKFHINYGLGGMHNGYYSLSENYYNYNMGAIFGLRPCNPNIETPQNLQLSTNPDGMVVSWEHSVGATYYQVFRNGELIATTTNTFILDSNCPYGPLRYQVAGASGEGMSFPSTATYVKSYDTPVATGLTLTNANESIQLNWTAPENGLNAFYHYPRNFNVTQVQHLPNSSDSCLWEEVFPTSEICHYGSSYIYHLGIWVSNNSNYALGKTHKVYLYTWDFDGETSQQWEYRLEFTPMNIGWYNLMLPHPIRLGCGQVEVYVKVLSSDDIIDYYDASDGYTNSYRYPYKTYYDSNNELKAFNYVEKFSPGEHLLINIESKWADELTYNVYRNDGQHTRCIARNLQEPSYTDDNVPAGLYSYYVTTNYFGGESEPSESVNVAYGNFNIVATSSPSVGGTVLGNQGSYPAGSTVTLRARAQSGYVFSCWTEDGQVVSNQPVYSFRAMSDRHLEANFVNLSFSLGTVITNPDGSKGVVFYINPTYTGGCMVALEDVSTGCTWGSSGDIPFVRNYTYTRDECLLSDLNGYANTNVLRDYQSANPNYASGKVDIGQGWYVPSAGQLRKLYGALPFIEVPMVNAGGTTLFENAYYWSSTESSESYAWTSAFEMSSSSKTSNYRLRAVHDFSINNTARVQVRTNNAELGTVAGSGFYTNGATVTVTATPTDNNLFRGWTEAGHLVSQETTYTFTANANRDLVANFAIRGGVGTLVTNPDGSQGILFYLNEDGSQGWMVALEDASEGCQWGPSNDVTIMKDRALNDQTVLRDQDGYYNTKLIRMWQGTDNGYAASIVDFDNGWYLPSSGQLRKLYAVMPLLEEALIKAGGSTLTDGKYWSSTEYSSSSASTPGFEVSYTSKTSNCRVRAIRNYVPAGDDVILVASNADYMGTALVAGSGVFAQNATVTVRAIPNSGYQFDHWSENGVTVSYNAKYQFPFTRSRSLVAHFVVPGTIGSIVHNLDGSQGVVFYVNPEGTEGLMVALEDVSAECKWGTSSDILVMPNEMFDGPFALRDNMGAENTDLLRICQGTNTGYAADVVDVADGWYLPSSGQLRKLYAALPLIEEQLVFAGGSLLTTDSYWSSTEYSSSNAFSPMFEMTNSSKTTNHRVRAVRSFLTSDVHSLVVKANNASFGSVTGSGNYGYGATVTVTAIPNVGFVFDHWTEEGATVSYDATYQFTFTRNRSLVAHFVRPGSVGRIVTNDDGSRGVVFYTDPTGTSSLIVSLEDVSDGCAWGANQDVLSLTNQDPGYVQRMLEDMDGSGNSIALRTWQNANPNYAVSQMDYDNGWFLPSSGQMRKLYAAMPLIEKAIVNAGGTLMGDNAYWSSSESSSNYAWSPSFEFTKTSKTSNLRVRAIREINVPINPGVIVQTTALSRGWNWFSTYVEITLDDLKAALVEALPGANIAIKSQNNGTATYNGTRWKGQLSSLNVAQMYMIGVSANCEITLEGEPLNPAEHPITIRKGWNWIGFPCSQSVSVGVALSGFSPESNDVIKGKNAYAVYKNGRWRGTLNTLEPGQGYMYGTGSNTPKTLVFQTGRGEATQDNITPENNFFQPTDDYADNMTLTAVVELDDMELRSEDYELAAFVGDECRGSVKLMYLEPINRYVAFLTVFGEQEEELRFQLTDGFASRHSIDRLAYAVDDVVGSLDNPMVLHFGPMDTEENASVNVKIYPNPSEGIFNIEGQNIRKVEVFNAFGQPVYSKDTKDDLMMIDLTNRATGIYLIRIVTDNGIWSHQVMKR